MFAGKPAVPMRSRMTPLLLAIEFLLAIEVCLTFWSEVGGQYDLDLMFWPWKFGLTLAAAGLITAMTAELMRRAAEHASGFSRKTAIYAALLIVVIATAGIVTYYYYMNEPADDNGDTPTQQTTRLYRTSQAPSAVRRCS
jgi:predicted outer membrane lipoprotein